jgi:hypothetical protein
MPAVGNALTDALAPRHLRHRDAGHPGAASAKSPSQRSSSRIGADPAKLSRQKFN